VHTVPKKSGFFLLACSKRRNISEKWAPLFFLHQHFWQCFSSHLSLCLSILSLHLPLLGTTNLMYVLHVKCNYASFFFFLLSRMSFALYFFDSIENKILQVMLQNVTRLCHTRSMVTVNGKFPGPRIVAREGDRLVIRVVNHVQNNISIHWYKDDLQFSPSIMVLLV
jgi:hypothetical protein